MELVVVETAVAEALLLSRSAAAAGSLWAWWLAAMAGAVGLWRFRSAAVASRPAAIAAMADGAAPPPPMKPDAAVFASRAEAVRSSLQEDCFCSPKGRFTAYFQAEAGEGEAARRDKDEAAAEEEALGDAINWRAEEEEEEEEEDGSQEQGKCGLGVVHVQNRAALNGSVVRLWDGDRTSTLVVPVPPVERRLIGRVVFSGKTGMRF